MYNRLEVEANEMTSSGNLKEGWARDVTVTGQIEEGWGKKPNIHVCCSSLRQGPCCFGVEELFVAG